MTQRVHVKRHEDRVSTSFSEDRDDVDCIITVTHDIRAVAGMSDSEIIAAARVRLAAVTGHS